MSGTSIETVGSAHDEAEKVIAWRIEELGRAGYGYDASIRLGERLDVDLHLACGLLQRGCTVEKALEILL